MALLKDFARFCYKIIPDGLLKKKLTCFAYKLFYPKFLREYRYEKGLFTVVTQDGITIKSVKDFDPAPLADDFKLLRPSLDAVVMDLGGNLGVCSIYLSALVGEKGRVIVYEPDNQNFQKMTQNFELNGVQNVIAVQKGVSDKAGKLTFYCGGNYTSSVHKTNYVKAEESQYCVEEIDVVTIDDEAKRLGLERLDLLKIDIEGSEVEALLGAKDTLERFHPDLIIETHIVGEKSTKDRIVEILQGYGYQYFLVTGLKNMPDLFVSYDKKME